MCEFLLSISSHCLIFNTREVFEPFGGSIKQRQRLLCCGISDIHKSCSVLSSTGAGLNFLHADCSELLRIAYLSSDELCALECWMPFILFCW